MLQKTLGLGLEHQRALARNIQQAIHHGEAHPLCQIQPSHIDVHQTRQVTGARLARRQARNLAHGLGSPLRGIPCRVVLHQQAAHTSLEKFDRATCVAGHGDAPHLGIGGIAQEGPHHSRSVQTA